ncbi:phage tail protein [Paenibacillus lactis]|uniref:Tail fiber repeat 2 protein n=1 Tax=Paenibacillus lactis 154 TaxID=743719 RepID=G4HLN3_9BACL|nr:phage tail protein [Paenibacillus lactis]EHB56959.1 tail fiber repeat 2 protein [Paenibacillus lactis 154]
MASNTPNLGLLKKDPMTDGNETFNIETMLNENWDKIDTAVGQVREGLENVNVDIPDASLTEKGIVQLSSATNGTRENVAATEKAVKAAYDEALAGKQLGVEQKANVVAALNSIGVSASTSETWAQLVSKMAGVIRATGNANPADVLAGKTYSNASGNGLTGTMPNRGAGGTIIPSTINQILEMGFYTSPITILGDPNLVSGNIRTGVSLFGVVGSLIEGKRWAKGQFSVGSGRGSVGGLSFKPRTVIAAHDSYQYSGYQTLGGIYCEDIIAYIPGGSDVLNYIFSFTGGSYANNRGWLTPFSNGFYFDFARATTSLTGTMNYFAIE